MKSKPAIILILVFSIASGLKAVTETDSSKRPKNKYPGSFLALGFSDRLSSPSGERFKIEYFNQGAGVNDTFRFNDRLGSSSNLVNFVMTLGVSNRYAGAKFDLGFVPFANRNSHQSISVFGLIPVNKRIIFSPVFGYTRLRKQKKIGTLTGSNGRINFMDKEYDEVSIRVHEVIHSYHYGLGLFVNLDEDLSLYLECRYNRIFRNTPRIKVSAYNREDGESFFESIISADQYDRFSNGDKEVLLRDTGNKPVTGFYNIGNLAFTAQLVIALKNGGGK